MRQDADLPYDVRHCSGENARIFADLTKPSLAAKSRSSIVNHDNRDGLEIINTRTWAAPKVELHTLVEMLAISVPQDWTANHACLSDTEGTFRPER